MTPERLILTLVKELWPFALGLGVLSIAIPVIKTWFKTAGMGKIGEFAVNAILKRGLPAGDYHLIPDVILPIDDGTTQIDHVVVSRYGIFVIETKAYKGWIFGSEKESQWTQQIFRKKSRFQNPLRQNYRHTKTLSDLTGIPHEYFISLVAFSGEAEFKTPMPPSVIHIRNVADTILKHTTIRIQDEQVPEVVDAIKAWVGTVTDDMRRNHVKNLNR